MEQRPDAAPSTEGETLRLPTVSGTSVFTTEDATLKLPTTDPRRTPSTQGDGHVRDARQPTTRTAAPISGMRAALALPWPRWLLGVAGGGSLLAVVLAFLIAVNVLGADWAGGAFAGGIAALVIAALAAALWTARFVMGQQAYTALGLTLVLVTVLAGLGVGGIQAAVPIHALEATHLEQAHRYQSAVQEYELAGERAPGSHALARTLTAWGEALLAQHRYAEAAVRFNTVVTLYTDGGPSVARATTDLYHTITAWLDAGAQNMPFSNVVDFLAAYRTSSACDATCQQQAATYESHARFLYGQQLLAAKDFLDAAEQFVLVQTKFGTSADAAQAHTLAATAYYDYGKAQVGTPSCANAVPIYKTLAKSYADTPQGSAATRALAAPGKVTGTLTGFDASNPPTLYLSRQADPTNFYYSDNALATVNAHTGAFAFTNVQQNAYFLSAVLESGGQKIYTLYHDKSSGQAFVVVVGPLCATNLGTVPYR